MLIFLYLWLLFTLFVLNEKIILGQRGIEFSVLSAHGFAAFNALVLAKIMLVAEGLNVGRWLHGRPLIYSILFQSFIISVLFICFHAAEKIIAALLKGDEIAASVPAIGGGGLPGLVCVAAILFVSLTPYFAFRNISRELGTGRLYEMLFGITTDAADRK